MSASGRVRCVVALDPGSAKCGIAVVRRDGSTAASSVVPRADAVAAAADLCSAYLPECLVVGDGTGSRLLIDELRSALPLVALQAIDERHSSEQARRLYLELHPARGLARLVPIGLRTPDAPYDDLVAVVLGRRWWALQPEQAGTTGPTMN